MLQATSLANASASKKDNQLALVGIHISYLSSIKGQLLANIDLPGGSRVLYVLRAEQPLVDLDALFLEENDVLYVATEDEEIVRQQLTF